MKIIHIAPNFTPQESAVVTLSNARRKLFIDLYGEQSVKKYNLLGKNKSVRQYLYGFVLGRYPQINIAMENDIIRNIVNEKIEVAVVETTRYGHLVEKIKKRTDCKTIVFAHDVEVARKKSINNVYLKEKKYLKWALNQLWSGNKAQKNESRTIKYADVMVTLHERDTRLMKAAYSRTADIEIPICIEDQYTGDGILSEAGSGLGELLFVGGNYFPNIEGISFFINTVLGKIPWKLRVVGKCADALSKLYQNSDKLELVGAVPDLAPYYNSADAVVAPIFSGGGMKTKTVEALMYGKSVYGTTEAFVGIKGDISKIGAVCNTSDEYIQALASIERKKFNKNSREIFLTFYSLEAEAKQLKQIFDNLPKYRSAKEYSYEQ